ncbi:MAG: carboxymuconolactone decarboxylase family protein [Bryobacteraceae bacterium]
MGTAIRLVEPGQNEQLAQLESKTGRPNNFFRTMAHRPEVLKNFVPLYASVVGAGSVERRLKELVYLAVSFANECLYCSTSHTASSKRAGLTADDIEAVRLEQDHRFSDPERAALAYARELTRTAEGQDTREGLYEHFNDQQIVEITLVAAMANFTNRFNNGLAVKPEES